MSSYWVSASTPQSYERFNTLGPLPDPGDNSVNFAFSASSTNPCISNVTMPVYAWSRSRSP